jgi:predicted kinase
MIILMRATSCSGKGTFIKKNFGEKNANHVLSSDEFREKICGTMSEQRQNKKVFDMMYNILESRLTNRVPLTIMDSTHIRFADCQTVVELSKKYHTPIMVISIQPPSIEELKERNESRMTQTGIYIPEDVLEKHLHRYSASMEPFIKEAMYNDYFKFTEIDQDYNVIRFVEGVDSEKL